MPPVSILVPARNEEIGIEACLISLASQNYSNFEVLVLDDSSSDKTGEIIGKLAADHSNIRIIPSMPLPEGWLGKNWACNQLAEAASGELLLFTDADTIHHPDSLRDGTNLLFSRSCDLLSAIPKEVVVTWPERFTVPIIVWILAALLPHRLAQHINLPIFSGAIGQYLLIRRQAYQQIGGYEAIKDQVADDFVLARRVKAYGLQWLMANGSKRIQCRMYRTKGEILDGLGKNLFAVFDHRITFYAFAWIWLVLAAWMPGFVLLAGVLSSGFATTAVFVSFASLIINITAWGLISVRYRLPQILALVHPVVLLTSASLAFVSAIQFWTGRAVWKGRRLHKRAIP